MFSLEKRKLRRPLFAVSHYLVGGYREDVVRHFLEVHNERTRDDSHKLQQEKFQLDVKKPLFFLFASVRVVQHWNRGPGRLWNLCPQKYSKFNQTRPGAT